MTTHELAADLRRLAEHLEAQPAKTTVSTPRLTIWPTRKDEFLALAAVMPRPLIKSISDPPMALFRLIHRFPTFKLTLSIYRDEVCEMATPAREATYDCVDILSSEELEAL